MSLEELRQENIRKSVEAALECFVEMGIANTKMSQIADRAGLAHRSLYRYFKNKTELVFNSAMLLWAQTMEMGEEAYKQSRDWGATGAQQIMAILLAYSQLYTHHRDKLIFELEAEVHICKSDRRDLLKNKPPAPFEESTGPLAKAIRNGLEDGTVRGDIDLESRYYNVYDSLLGLMGKMAVTATAINLHGVDPEKRLKDFCKTLAASFTVLD